MLYPWPVYLLRFYYYRDPSLLGGFVRSSGWSYDPPRLSDMWHVAIVRWPAYVAPLSPDGKLAGRSGRRTIATCMLLTIQATTMQLVHHLLSFRVTDAGKCSTSIDLNTVRLLCGSLRRQSHNDSTSTTRHSQNSTAGTGTNTAVAPAAALPPRGDTSDDRQVAASLLDLHAILLFRV